VGVSAVKVLVLTSEENLFTDILAYLNEADFAVQWTTSLSERDREDGMGLILLDWRQGSLREKRGLVNQLREAKVPCVAIVDYRDLADIDFPVGINDFLLAPIKPHELRARVQALLKTAKSERTHPVIRSLDLTVDQEKYEVSVGGQRVLLTFKEYQLLVLLVTNPGKVYTREELLMDVWAYDYFGGTRTVDVHIRRLRSKIEDADHSVIETVRNVGYRFTEP
jgi:two-component system alkaline phosphatase synthesis response regulator PhoP